LLKIWLIKETCHWANEHTDEINRTDIRI